MSLVTITCPHCALSKSVDSSKIPPGSRKIKCPKCQQQFDLHLEQPGFAFEQVDSPELSQPAAQGRPVANPVQQPPQGPSKFCPTCGSQIHLKAEICPNCGVRSAPSPTAVNKVALLLLAFFLGGIGGHKFYLKKNLQGFFYLLFFWTYIPTLIALVEFIIYACKSEEELQRRYPEVGGVGAIVAIIAVPVVLAIIGIMAAIAIPQFAAYRMKAYDSLARQDLELCRMQAESYLADYNAFPTDPGQISCQASQNVALYYLAFGPSENQIISFHKNGRNAYLVNSATAEITEESRESLEQEISEKFGSEMLTPSFHFIQ